jgi:hypothetical protein
VQQAAGEETRRLLDVAGAQHELALRQLKERLAKVSCLDAAWHCIRDVVYSI